jgi:UDP-N-acetylmuramate dehydrogenase
MCVLDLTGLTTLKLPLHARQVLKISSVENACISGPEIASQPALILGGGSNLVVFELNLRALLCDLRSKPLIR